LILAFDAIFVPGFFKIGILDGHPYGNLIDILNNAAPLMLVAIGMTLVIATGGVDLSVGAVIAISGRVACSLIYPASYFLCPDLCFIDPYTTDHPLWVVVLAILVAGTLCGLWNGLLVSRGKIQPVVATLILMVAGRGIAQLITHGQIVTVYYPPYLYFGNGFILGLPVSLYIVALVFLCAWVLVRKTALGLFIAAVGGNAKAAEYSGINVKNIRLFVYTFCGFCAAIAGLILSSNIKAVDPNNIGLNYELDAILAVVLGGTLMTGGRFSLFGSVLGALIVWTLTITMYTVHVPANVLLAGRAVLVLVVVILYSDSARRFLKRPAR
jgi:ribose/xylose/arabinose/galactoside ABC-type transport system permease subunit